jgi:hypothetical protein
MEAQAYRDSLSNTPPEASNERKQTIYRVTLDNVTLFQWVGITRIGRDSKLEIHCIQGGTGSAENSLSAQGVLAASLMATVARSP